MPYLPEGELSLSGLTVDQLSPATNHALFDLTLYHRECAEGIALHLVYNADLFDEPRMAEFLAQFQCRLEQAAEDPGRRLAEFSLVPPAAQQLLPDPAEALDVTDHGPVHAALARHARRGPGRVALVDSAGPWTYGELEELSNKLAHALRAHGLRPEEVVAVYAHRSAPLVLAVLGILKAGGAFLILDPAYPEARLVEYLRLAA